MMSPMISKQVLKPTLFLVSNSASDLFLCLLKLSCEQCWSFGKNKRAERVNDRHVQVGIVARA
jgi:hypothetical protein